VSYNGSGTFNINSSGQPVVTGTVITSTAFNALTADLGTGLTTALTKDGQTTPTANIKLGAFKLINVGDATTAGDAVTWGGPASHTTFTTTGVTTLQTLTVGLGASAVATNTALGVTALAANTTGAYNVAVGASALTANTTGPGNNANGYQALIGNTTGSYNTASGMQTLYTNTTGGYNIALGYQALFANTTASYNVGIGSQALTTNTTGSSLTAVGAGALQQNTTGNNNTAVGFLTMYTNSTGNYNAALGYQALYANTGSSNTALGYTSLSANTTGSGNVMVGGLTSAGAYAPPFNPTTQNDRVMIGSTSTTNAYVQVAWTAVSDARDKTDFGPVPLGLDFVTNLKPTTYRYKINRDDTEGHGPLRYGFLAQEVLALEGASPVIIDNEDPDKLKITDQSLIAVLVNAIQELQARLFALEAK
jgi:trimeric autotransporter adhesin